MATLGQPRIQSIRPVGGNWVILGRTVNSQIASSIIQDTEYNVNHAGIKGYEKTWMQNERTEDAGYRIEEMPRSLVAPLKRGRRIKQLMLFSELYVPLQS